MEQEVRHYGFNKTDEMVEGYKKALDKVWKHITGLKEFGNECKCNSSDNPDTSFDTIDYTGDAPSVNRWCLDCGGYRGV
jgi:hypothetical protein